MPTVPSWWWARTGAMATVHVYREEEGPLVPRSPRRLAPAALRHPAKRPRAGHDFNPGGWLVLVPGAPPGFAASAGRRPCKAEKKDLARDREVASEEGSTEDE